MWSSVGLGLGLCRHGLALLADLGGLAAQTAQVVQLGATHVTTRDDLDPVDDRGVEREGALDADAERDLADGEGLADATTVAADDDSWKIWTRARVPSTTLTWTLSVSPARNSGMSERSEAASSASNVCMMLRFPGRHRSPVRCLELQSVRPRLPTGRARSVSLARLPCGRGHRQPDAGTKFARAGTLGEIEAVCRARRRHHPSPQRGCARRYCMVPERIASGRDRQPRAGR